MQDRSKSQSVRLVPAMLGSRIGKGTVSTVLFPRRLVREKNDGGGRIPSGLLAELADREELVEVLAVLGLVQASALSS